MFRCDRCNSIMEYDSDRYWIKGNLEGESKLDLCSKCLNAVKHFIDEEEIDDEKEERDNSLRYKKVYRK